MRTLRQRVLVTLIATLLAGGCGWGGGYLLGSQLALRQARHQLQANAERLMAEENATLKETYATLKKMSSSPYPRCSAAELDYFRKLLFQTDYLRDGGRMGDGKIACSATLNAAGLAHAALVPQYTMPGGTKVYKAAGLLQVRDQPTFALQFGDFYVVVNSGADRRLDKNPVPFIVTVVPASQKKPGRLMSSSPQPDDAIFTQEGFARKRDTLYFTRCTPDSRSCVSTYVAIADAIHADRAVLRYFMTLGAAVGALFGFVLSLLYRRSRSMEQQLRRAVSKDRPRVVYQPIVDPASRRIVGAEALARWTDEDGFEIGPDVFVKIAEQCGFMGALTRIILRRALREMGPVLRAHPDFKLSINISASDLSDPLFLPMLEHALARESVAPPSVVIEITESSTARNSVAAETIRQLRARGHSVHVDDFGTGYSSLSYLHDLDVDAIKIDQSFTRAIGTEAVTVGILPQILAMAHALRLHVIVEGVETGEQARYFAGLSDPVQMQGWLFGRPVPAGDFQRILAENEQKGDPSASAG